MRILVSGSSGFIGGALVAHLRAEGHAIVRLIRRDSGEPDAIFWDPDKGVCIKEQFEGFDAAVHLSGEPIAKRWTEEQRKKILFSRTVSTFFLSHILAQALRPPKVFLSASGIGFYGERGEEELTESSSAGSGFLAKVCCEWEKASLALRQRGVRTVQMRFGMVLGAQGGALQKMAAAYRFFLGGALGTGKQWVSWIALEDLIRAITFALHNKELEGPVNGVSPYPVRQQQFAKTLASALHRPAVLHQPAWLLRLVFGQMATELLLASQRAFPEKLLQAGFTFRQPSLDMAITSALE